MKSLFSFFALLLLSVSLLAQTGIIRGFVYDKANGEPIIFTNVYLKGTSLGAPTDNNGYFTISQIPAGDYELMITYLGYDTLREQIKVAKGEVITRKYYLTQSGKTLNAVNIYGEVQDLIIKPKVSEITITPKEIYELPMIGNADMAQYLQMLPGVVSTGDQGGQLYIRGGSSIQNKVLLDGMVVYNPFHSIGLFSVFETEIIRTVNVYTGGFGAEYGGRISSVMDITTRDGNKMKYSGLFSGSPFGANLVFEGPIVKDDGSGSSTSFMLAAKNSYLSNSSKLFYQYIDTAGLPFDFRDIYGKISINTGNGSKISFFGFNFTDDVLYRQIANFSWEANGGGVNFVLIPGTNPALLEGLIAYSDYQLTLTDQTNLPKSSEINGFNMSLAYTSFPNNTTDVKYGLELLGFNTNLQFYNSALKLIQQEQNTTEFAFYLKYKTVIDSTIIIEPSFRLHMYPSLSETSPEPRLAMKYNVADKFRIKLAGGYYSQNLISAASDRDVVNLFFGFLSGPDNLQDEFDGEEVTSALQKAKHAVLGFEFGPYTDSARTYNLTFNVELYYKMFTQLTNLNRNKVYDDTYDYASKPDYLKKDFIIEEGDAEGIEISARFEARHFYINGAYTIGWVNRFDGIIEYNPHYDRRHNINLVASYQPGDLKRWVFSVRWNLGSGFPFTRNSGFYPYITFEDGLETDIFTAEQELGILYDEYNTGRLPWFHRLDFSVKKIFALSETTKLESTFSITNAYNRQNVFYFDRITNERVDQLPLMPSLGVALRF